MIQSSKTPQLNLMFGPPTDGFRWLTLTLSGTASAPADNFKELFTTAAQAKKPAASGDIPSFEDLTAPK